MVRMPAAVTSLAATQSGLLTRHQLLAAGLTRRQIDRLAAPGGRGSRPLPRVYALTTGPLSRRQQLVGALLYVGEHGQVSGATALELYGFRYAPVDALVHVLVPMRRQVPAVAFVVPHRTQSLPRPRLVQGLPTVPAARAAVDAARRMQPQQATATLAEAVQRRLCTMPMLLAELRAGPSAGSAVVRTALARIGSGAASVPETDLVALVATSLVLPAPLVNERLVLGNLVVVPDLCWPQARLVVEVDSVEHHGFGPDAEQTSRRRARLVAAGWAVLSISPQRCRLDPVGVLHDIEAAYLAGIARTTA
jgi:very-short-patch-repair endonuclease